MKKIFLSLAAVASLSAAHAQKLGDVFVNGSIGFTHNNSETTVGNQSVNGPITNTFFIVPSVGYQFSNNWGAGLALGYGFQRTRSTAMSPAGTSVDMKSTGNTFGVGPFLRYTKHLSPLFFVNGQLTAMYVTSKTTSEVAGTSSTTGRSNGVDVNVMPSVGINVTRTLALTGSFGRIGYATSKVDDLSNPLITDKYSRNNTFDATFGREFMLGVQWNFATDGGRARRSRREPMSETRRMDRYRDTDTDTETTEEAPRRRERRDRRDRD